MAACVGTHTKKEEMNRYREDEQTEALFTLDRCACRDHDEYVRCLLRKTKTSCKMCPRKESLSVLLANYKGAADSQLKCVFFQLSFCFQSGIVAPERTASPLRPQESLERDHRNKNKRRSQATVETELLLRACRNTQRPANRWKQQVPYHSTG